MPRTLEVIPKQDGLPKSKNNCHADQANPGSCRKGPQCRYQHQSNQHQINRHLKPCFAFERGTCNKGSNCNYSHNMVLGKRIRQFVEDEGTSHNRQKRSRDHERKSVSISVRNSESNGSQSSTRTISVDYPDDAHALLSQVGPAKKRDGGRVFERQNSSEHLLTVKFSLKSDGTADIRRLKLDCRNWETAFQEMETFAKSTYGYLLQKFSPSAGFIFQYMDDENDLVGMTSASELEEAANVMKRQGRNTLKVQVSVAEGLKSSSLPLESSKHGEQLQDGKPKRVNVRIHWGRGETTASTIGLQGNLAGLKQSLQMNPNCKCAINGEYMPTDNTRPFRDLGLRDKDVLCFWSNEGLDVPTKPGRPQSYLTERDVPAVVLTAVRLNLIPKLCLAEIRRGEVGRFVPGQWLVDYPFPFSGRIDGFQQRLEAYYPTVLNDLPTMEYCKGVYINDLKELRDKAAPEETPDFLPQGCTLPDVEKWFRVLEQEQALWKKSYSPSDRADYNTFERNDRRRNEQSRSRSRGEERNLNDNQTNMTRDSREARTSRDTRNEYSRAIRQDREGWRESDRHDQNFNRNERERNDRDQSERDRTDQNRFNRNRGDRDHQDRTDRERTDRRQGERNARAGKQLCYHFPKGTCKFGQDCKFSHDWRDHDREGEARTEDSRNKDRQNSASEGRQDGSDGRERPRRSFDGHNSHSPSRHGADGVWDARARHNEKQSARHQDGYQNNSSHSSHEYGYDRHQRDYTRSHHERDQHRNRRGRHSHREHDYKSSYY
mmetsp:Transcript_50726/g.99383  ORF Transcript_50726/g.99383 Transcript_50726/m.99383 type:complete len:774 (-) Transcript_50726:171-2492(-)